jgi:Asp-tRNA(Asn)/Glu-tRNA(Gln) amidotransferase A subunit family amidase
VGPFARTVADLAAAFDALQGADPGDPVCTTRAPQTVTAQLGAGVTGLRLAVAGGHFAQLATDEALTAFAIVTKALGASREVTVPEAHRARAAAQVITACEGSAIHLEDLRTRAAHFDPTTRERFLAGALLPAQHYLAAQRFRAWYRARVAEIFRDVDVLLAPTTPWVAPAIGAPRTTTVGGVEVLTRPHNGVFTQPLSFVGLPVISVPVARPASLPLGVQLIGAPFAEAALFRVAAHLEAQGVVAAPVAAAFAG